MSDSPRAGVRQGRAAAAVVGAGICAGMLSLAVFVPPRQGGASPAPQPPLVDEDGWIRAGELTSGALTVEILLRDDQRRYTVRDARGRILGERVDGAELTRRWGVDLPSMSAAEPGALMMVDPDRDALLGR